jgi:hypothetical protein
VYLWPGATLCGACRGAKCCLPAPAALLARRTCIAAVKVPLKGWSYPYLQQCHQSEPRHVFSAGQSAAHVHTSTRLQCASRWRKQQCVLPALASAAAARLRARPRPAAGPEPPLGPCRVPAGLAHGMLPPLTSMCWIGVSMLDLVVQIQYVTRRLGTGSSTALSTMHVLRLLAVAAPDGH